MRAIASTLAVLILVPGPGYATISTFLDDDFDDRKLVSWAHDRPEVMATRKRFENFEQSLWRLKERDFIAVFGKPKPKPAKTYALPVAAPRGLMLSGLRYGDPAMNRDRTDFYVVKDIGGLEVYYHIDGETPQVVVVYLLVDRDFPRLTKDNLERRLAWDAARLEQLRAYTDARLVEVFPWEVDQAELEKLHAGDYAVDSAVKLKAWIESGEALGYEYRHPDKTVNEWSWYDRDGRLVRQASRAPGGTNPVAFEWFHPDGGELRKEMFSYRTRQIESRRWCRPTGGNIRYETRGTWCWYGPDGKPIRQEWDDNGDGIPDRYVTAEDGIDHAGDRNAMERRKPLDIADSWAINPELIPKESRIVDQPDLRVPIRWRGPGSPPTRDGPPSKNAAETGSNWRAAAFLALTAAIVVLTAALVCRRFRSRADRS